MGGSLISPATGGTWSGGAGIWTDPTDVANSRYTAGASESGTITLTFTPIGGSCGAADAITKTITVTSIPSINAGSDQVVCHGGSFTLSSLASSGTIPYNYLWSNGSNNASFTSIANYITVNTYPCFPRTVNNTSENYNINPSTYLKLFIHHVDVKNSSNDPNKYGSIKFTYNDGTIDEFRFWGNGGLRVWDVDNALFTTNYGSGIWSTQFINAANATKQSVSRVK
jgi:hypothetical protein